jgi:hypothetical protein
MSELIRCGIGTIYIGIESFQPDVLERESLVKRDGDVEAIFEATPAWHLYAGLTDHRLG